MSELQPSKQREYDPEFVAIMFGLQPLLDTNQLAGNTGRGYPVSGDALMKIRHGELLARTP